MQAKAVGKNMREKAALALLWAIFIIGSLTAGGMFIHASLKGHGELIEFMIFFGSAMLAIMAGTILKQVRKNSAVPQ